MFSIPGVGGRVRATRVEQEVIRGETWNGKNSAQCAGR